jgi:uncharacterized protein
VVVLFSVPAIAAAYLGAIANDAISARALILAFISVMLTAAALTYARGAGDDGDDERDCHEVGAVQAGSCGIVVGVMTRFSASGGGFLIVPALTNLLCLPVRGAIATSLAIITVTSVGAVASHLIEGNQPDWPQTAVLCISAAAGALAGSALGQPLQPRQLANAFAAVVAGIAVFSARRRARPRRAADELSGILPGCRRRTSTWCGTSSRPRTSVISSAR